MYSCRVPSNRHKGWAVQASMSCIGTEKSELLKFKSGQWVSEEYWEWNYDGCPCLVVDEPVDKGDGGAPFIDDIYSCFIVTKHYNESRTPKASERELKMQGLLRQPNVSLTEKYVLYCPLTPKRCHWDGCRGITLKMSVMSALPSHAPLPASLMNLIALSTVA